MDTPLTSRFPFEVFHYVGEIDPAARDTCLLQTVRQQPSGGASKGPTVVVLRISRLLAYEKDLGICRTFAEDGLCGSKVKVTSPATFGCLFQDGQRALQGKIISGGMS
jgi:hypothetical protein